MSNDSQQKSVYVVLSQTGSIVAKMIKVVTRNEFCHASISLTEDLRWMYSFGRRHPYNPFWGGFVRESPDMGTMKRFYDSDIAIIKIDVTPEELEGIRQTIGDMLLEQQKYHYNYIGLFKAGLNIKQPPRQYHYYCSEFVSAILSKNNIAGAEELPSIVHPTNFLDLPYTVIYRGRLCDYAESVGAS